MNIKNFLRKSPISLATYSLKTKTVCESQRADHPQRQKSKIKKLRSETTLKNGEIPEKPY